jgi:hypothetical protein
MVKRMQQIWDGIDQNKELNKMKARTSWVDLFLWQGQPWKIKLRRVIISNEYVFMNVLYIMKVQKNVYVGIKNI